MAKSDVKSYILSRFTALSRTLNINKDDQESIYRIAEVKNMAANFGIKTKELDKIKTEIEA